MLTITTIRTFSLTFEPVGPDVGVDPVPSCNGSASPLSTRVGLISHLPFCRNTSFGHVQFDEGSSQASRSATFGVREWAKKQTLVDIVSRVQD